MSLILPPTAVAAATLEQLLGSRCICLYLFCCHKSCVYCRRSVLVQQIMLSVNKCYNFCILISEASFRFWLMLTFPFFCFLCMYLTDPNANHSCRKPYIYQWAKGLFPPHQLKLFRERSNI